ncbi:MAG TPA: helix-hairpin-helix domain-containing protein [Candidatus Thermoplasmatota archaeon]|nr:helix-hairpin-helix domain-containing protein [Candidatus Thermoplasmatota archaeon]
MDNSPDPTLKSLLSKDEKALESVRRRLSGDSSITRTKTEHFSHTFRSLEPRVSVHEKISVSPRLITPVPTVEPPHPLPEFELVSTSTPSKPMPSLEVRFDSEDLFEVEKVDVILPEFLEVTPEETIQAAREKEMTLRTNSASVQDSNLPEWQPVADEETSGMQKTDRKPNVDDSPEFDRVDSAITLEKSVESETHPAEEIPVEPSVEFQQVESPEPPFIILTRKKHRDEKRAERKKERDAKKLKKIELKQIKKESREKEQEAKRIITEQYPLPPPDEQTLSKTESISTVETPSIKLDLDAFNDIECIDENTAELLYKNGYFSAENIKDATVDDLVEIRGIKRKLAKQIKKEIEQKITLSENEEFTPIKQKTTKKILKNTFEDDTEWESYPAKEKIIKPSPSNVCIYEGFTLYKRETRKHDGKKTTIHFFSKEKPEKGHPARLPSGYQIAINKKTGIPFLKKKR